MRRFGRAGLLLILGVSCGDDPVPSGEAGQPPGWDREVRLVSADDRDPHPSRVELELEAGQATVEIAPDLAPSVWTYGGSLPGPLLRATKGDRITVHLRNELPDSTTIHWHGVRLPNAMDGVPEHTQPPVRPGGTYTYAFDAPDAGLYWYHPHVASTAQVGFGLYGPLLVDDPGEPTLGDELVLVLSDMSLEDDGRLSAPDDGGDIATVFGREGDFLLVNGRVRPTVDVRIGRRLRLRLVNAARSRYLQLELAGHRFVRIGGDAGRIPEAQEEEHPLLAPGQRSDLLLVPGGSEGDELPLLWIPFDRGYGSFEFRQPAELLRFRLVGPTVATPELPAAALRGPAVERLELEGAPTVDLRLTLDGTVSPPSFGLESPGGARSLRVPVGETRHLRITNETDWAHPFHLHGFFFQVVDASSPPEWRDTVSVPVRGALDLGVVFAERPGMWMAHCHILDHADGGMMTMFEVLPPGE